jgi:hypothetical protein
MEAFICCSFLVLRGGTVRHAEQHVLASCAPENVLQPYLWFVAQLDHRLPIPSLDDGIPCPSIVNGVFDR